MNTKEYFEEQLRVSFTMQELYSISSALATESFNEHEKKRDCNAENAWNIRKKVNKYIDLYSKIYK